MTTTAILANLKFKSILESLQIIRSQSTPTLGQNYSLTCHVTHVTFASYQWRKSRDNVKSDSSILFFSPLRLSDAGLYTCIATMGSRIVNNSETILSKSKYKLLMEIS